MRRFERGRGRRVSPRSLANLRPWPKGVSGNLLGRPPRIRWFDGMALEREVVTVDLVGLSLGDVVVRLSDRLALKASSYGQIAAGISHPVARRRWLEQLGRKG